MHNQNKFLVQFIRGLDERLLFFGVWAFVVGGFSLLMWNFYRKSQQRNFKESFEIKSKGMTVKENNPRGTIEKK